MSRELWPRPTRRGLGVIAAGLAAATIGAFLSSMPLVFAGVALVALVVVALIVVSVHIPALSVVRRFSPDRAVAGWSVVETIGVRSDTARSSVSIRIRESLAWRVMLPDEAVVATIEPGGTATATFLLEDLPRGRHRVGPARIDVVESFGVARRLVTVQSRSELVVMPEVVSIGRGRESRSLGEGARQRRDHSVSGGQDDPITREYRRGDPMRRVHWKATARQGELMVRQEEQHGLPSVRVVVPVQPENWRDCHPALGSGAAVSDGFEWAIAAAASIAVEYGLAGSQTRVITVGGDTIALHDPSMTPLFLEGLAQIALGDIVDERTPDATPREPVIAVVSSLSADELDQLGRTRGPGVAGVALVVHLDIDPLTAHDDARDSPSEVAAFLREAGWQVVETDSSADLRDVLAVEGVLGG